MKITIERGEGTTTVHIEGSGFYSAPNSRIDDPWLTTGRALQRMLDCSEGDDPGVLMDLEVANAGPVGRAAIRVMAASFMESPSELYAAYQADSELPWAEYWGKFYPDPSVTRRALEIGVKARERLAVG